MIHLFFLPMKSLAIYSQARVRSVNGLWISFLSVCSPSIWGIKLLTLHILYTVIHLPEWLPGMGFKRTARLWAAKTASLCDKPYAFVQHQIVRELNEIDSSLQVDLGPICS